VPLEPVDDGGGPVRFRATVGSEHYMLSAQECERVLQQSVLLCWWYVRRQQRRERSLAHQVAAVLRGCLYGRGTSPQQLCCSQRSNREVIAQPV
jgi:hypothetical protein